MVEKRKRQTWRMYMLIVNEYTLKAARKSYKMLEPYEGKLSRTVLRGESGSNTADSLDYSPLVEALEGQVIKISPISKDYVNPLDINIDYADEDNPLSLKSDFILSLFELVVGEKKLSAEEISVIDRCLPILYKTYFENPVSENMPILEDLYNLLQKQEETVGKKLAVEMEIYVKGSLNVFNHRTNVDTNNRVVCYDIKELGKQLKKIGMLIIQDVRFVSC